MNNTLTALNGVRVGHSTHLDKLTGCSVVLFDKPMPVAYKSYGGAAVTYNTEMLQNGKSFYRRHGLFVAGGSLQGMMSITPIMQRMIDDKIGFMDANIINPSISGAIVFDKGTFIAPYKSEYGAEAYDNLTYEPVKSGNVGAGTGVSVGDFQMLENGTKIGSMKGGVGSARVDVGNGVYVCAMSVVNSVGNIVNPDGSILAGARDIHKKYKTFEDTTDFVTQNNSNTTISIVGMNLKLGSREAYERVAHMATHGQVRAINPVHTSIDGDTVFVFSNEDKELLFNEMGQYFETPDWPLFTLDIIGNAAATAVQESIYDAVKSAETVQFDLGYQGIIPSYNDY